MSHSADTTLTFPAKPIGNQLTMMNNRTTLLTAFTNNHVTF